MFISFIPFGPGADLIGIVQPVLGLALSSGAVLHMPNPQREKGADLRREEHDVRSAAEMRAAMRELGTAPITLAVVRSNMNW
ncbi:hypothetical protein EAS61_39570 [Bradyrhizobium zhanjiangense]|uniref:Uncharacterized protein n=2 Tax=Nitrobacteraceae TaxID=41294 RepID=A0A4Q0Q7L3_9BRAD|nr:hypothetical protein EAS61_39570 [Bradyrhizobium zhanjiangense]